MRSVCACVVELLHISGNYTLIKILSVAQKRFYGKFISPVKRNVSTCSCIKWPMLHWNKRMFFLHTIFFICKIWQNSSLRSFSVLVISAVKQFTSSDMDLFKFLLTTNLMHFFMYLFILFHVYMSRASSIHHQFPPDRRIKQSLTQTNHTRWCINTIRSPDDKHLMLETCRQMKWINK
jgi:hypothetical protein